MVEQSRALLIGIRRISTMGKHWLGSFSVQVGQKKVQSVHACTVTCSSTSFSESLRGFRLWRLTPTTRPELEPEPQLERCGVACAWMLWLVKAVG